MAHAPYHRDILHLDQQIHLQIVRAKRKSLAIHVFPGERHTEVRVPLKCPWFEIDQFIESRLDWLVDALQKMAQEPGDSHFRSGELHGYLGKTYVLEACFGRNGVLMTPDKLWVSCKEPGSEALVQKVFYEFLRRESAPIFQERMNHCLADFPISVVPTGLRVRRMSARWGSCSEKGEICLNTLLAQKSTEVIDMVITHELCHLVHFRHNRQFYQLMDQAMPDWRVREFGLSMKLEPDFSSQEDQDPEQLSFL
jgi:predicted metal-dependent hydrolase